MSFSKALLAFTQMVEAKPVAIATITGVAGSVALNYQWVDALNFGCRAAVGVSAIDVLLTAAGVDTKLEAYMPVGGAAYFDPSDLVSGALGAGAFGYMAGLQGRDLSMAVGVTAVAAAVAPKLVGYVVSSLMNLTSMDKSDIAATSGEAQNH